MKQMVVIDCQRDFIDGNMACHQSETAVETIVSYILAHPEMEVYYSLDWHSLNNHSFKRWGGLWPDHCIQNTWGSSLSPKFWSVLQKPTNKNCFYKGLDDVNEEYSAYHAKNSDAEILAELIEAEVLVCGIASEYCVMETVKAFIQDGKKVWLLKAGLGYVDRQTHQQAMLEFDRLGVSWIEG